MKTLSNGKCESAWIIFVVFTLLNKHLVWKLIRVRYLKKNAFEKMIKNNSYTPSV